METFDEKWEEVHKSHAWGKYPSEEVIRFVARNFYSKDRKNIKLLDAGCGTGAIAWFIAREGFCCYGFDGSPSAIENGVKRMKIEGLEAELKVGDAGAMAYENEFFDAVIDSAMLMCNTIEQIRQILDECHRILKNGGKIFSTVLLSKETTGYGTGEELEKNTYRNCTIGCVAGVGTVHFFSRDEIYMLWQAAGFKNIKIDTMRRTDFNGKVVTAYYMVEADK